MSTAHVSGREAAGMPSRTLARIAWDRVRETLLQPTIWMVFSILVLEVGMFQLLRFGLFLRNRDLADVLSAKIVARAFLVGVRFDASVAAFSCIPVILLTRLAGVPWGRTGERRVCVALSVVLGVVFILMGLGEIEFYREFYCRYNTLVVDYTAHGGTVMSMIWYGYPVVRYLLIAILLVGAYIYLTFRAGWMWLPVSRPPAPRQFLIGAFSTVGAIALLAVLARGGLRGTPLQWGDAVHSDSTFGNHLAQNGIWTLAHSILTHSRANGFDASWRNAMPAADAYELTQRLVLQPHEKLEGDSAKYPLLRRSHGGERSVSLSRVSDRPPNVVIVLMESFTGRHVGVLGSDNDRTPEYNRLAQQGILFDRCFSNGSHTHQAAYVVMASFPNLPGYECLMESTQADQKFDALPMALKRRGYETMFLYNGDLAWDNMEGFFKIQGIDRFIGRDDFDGSAYRDATWGVSDRELFERANQEFAAAKKPFYATILTLSNHAPFKLPKPLPFPEETAAGELNGRLNGIRFADWSIGHFFELARQEEYFQNTIFVLVGDHGFSVKPVLTDLNLLRHHVPLLFYAPALLGTDPRRRHTVVSHLDITPTIQGLLGEEEPHQHWGRDLFTLPMDDPGYAIFKPSGGAPEVGFARDDLLLVRGKSGKGHLYHYDLGFPSRVTQLDSPDPGQIHEMEKEMQAFIQTGLEVLTSHHVAP